MNHLEDKMKKFLENKEQNMESMAEQFEKVQMKLKNTQVVGSAGIEDEEQIFVKIVANGLQQIEEVKIGEGAIQNGAQVTADLCKAAFNSALEKLKSIMQKEVMGAYQQLGMDLRGHMHTDDK